MEEVEIAQKLREMEKDSTLVTKPSFRANTEVWPDNTISFVDHHLSYLKQHPTTNPQHYISNLRLKLRIRP